MKNEKLLIIPLGGMGNVTQNMFVYQYEKEMLIVDCGIGFPDQYTPGADIIIPDINYLLSQIDQGVKIVGMILSHGHDDHIAALPYLLPELPDFPIYASDLTAGFAEQRIKDAKIKKKIKVVQDKSPVKVGQHFEFELFHITHSVPETKHIFIKTPEGMLYHGTDFKLDKHPVDKKMSDLPAIAAKSQQDNVELMLMDCLRVENSEWGESESAVGPAIEKHIKGVKGKFIVTLMSSHLHRIQQVVDIAVKHDRKIAFIGRSVEQNVKVALNLGKLDIPTGVKINKKKLDQYPDHELVVVIAGSQGQEGSSMVRAVFGEHRSISINQQDKVIISADAIPGNEIPYYRAVDELAKNQIEVIYPSIDPGVHHSGHASAPEQEELLDTVKPKFVMPMGGADRHRELFRKRVAHKLGYSDHQVLLPETGQIISLENGDWKVEREINLAPRIVDGKGIGDVGPIVLADRRALSEAGIVVVVIPRYRNKFDLENIEVISRGFVFMKQADEVVAYIEDATAEIVAQNQDKMNDYRLKNELRKQLERKLYKVIEREPVVLPVILDSGE